MSNCSSGSNKSSKVSGSNRPLSPHLSIYKPQITSVLSIMHRLTGIMLYAGLVLLIAWVVFSTYGCLNCVQGLFSHQLVKAILILWTMALYYHLLNGVRHLFWDAGRGYELNTLCRTGYLVIFGTVVLTFATWFLPLLYEF